MLRLVAKILQLTQASLSMAILLLAMPLWCQWESAPSLKTPRRGAAVAAVTPYLYVMGGATTNNEILNTVERFDTITQEWDTTTVPAFANGRVDAAAAVYDGEVYLIGGRDANGYITDRVDIYNPVNNSWSPGIPMKTKREGHAVTLLFGKICAMGGLDQDGNFAEKIEWFTGSQWKESVSDIFTPRVAPFLAASEDSVFMFGGINIWPACTGFGAQVTQTWLFNWYPLPNLTFARGGGASVMLGKKMYLIGGVTFSGTSDLVEIYDPQTNMISTAGPMLNARTNFGAVADSTTIYAIGGYNGDPAQPLAAVEYYRQSTTGIGDDPVTTPATFLQIKGYPNPFNGQITLSVSPREPGNYLVNIYDLSGRMIRNVFAGRLSNGQQDLRWDATDNNGLAVGSGVYFAVLQGNGERTILRLVYIR